MARALINKVNDSLEHELKPAKNTRLKIQNIVLFPFRVLGIIFCAIVVLPIAFTFAEIRDLIFDYE